MTNGKVQGCLSVLDVRLATLKSALDTQPDLHNEVKFQYDRVLRAFEKLRSACSEEQVT